MYEWCCSSIPWHMWCPSTIVLGLPFVSPLVSAAYHEHLELGWLLYACSGLGKKTVVCSEHKLTKVSYNDTRTRSTNEYHESILPRSRPEPWLKHSSYAPCISCVAVDDVYLA
ncbi:hypothetical protein F5Y11DRAFT_265000 [Daldinia sp. FL1419]|nr:hypothetical protein F5Y11DRAFT_265000 [Daldinia sp. FL1419]